MYSIEDSIRNTLLAEGAAVTHMATKLDMGIAEQIIQLFSECQGKIFVTGCGTSGAAARKIAHTLCCINRPASYLNPADSLHGGLGIVSDKDIVVFLSKGGSTPEIAGLVGSCKEKGATTIGISENTGSKLAKTCDIHLKIAVEKEPDPFNMLATASTLTVIAVMDAIAIAVMEKTEFTREDFKVIHPNGAVGDRLVNHKK